MTYVVHGLSAQVFTPLFELDGAALSPLRARRVHADSAVGYPCRVSLEEARAGESLLLLNHVSHEVETPFRTSHAIYVRQGAEQARPRADSLPPMLDKRRLSLRGFDAAGMLRAAMVAHPGDGDAGVRVLLNKPEIVEVHAHNAAYGCFLARIGRN